jgi:hypothetical protein
VGACGQGSTPPRDEPPAAKRPPPDAREASFARSPASELRALGVALDGVDHDATRQWVERAARRGHPDDPMPPATEHAVAALVAWDASGAPMTIDCQAPEESLTPDLPTMPGLLDTAKAAVAASTAPGDPKLHAALRMGQALRSGGRDPMAFRNGIDVATEVAYWATAHHLRPASVIGGAGPTSADVRAGTLAEFACTLAAVPRLRLDLRDPDTRAQLRAARQQQGLPATEADLDDEPHALEKYLNDTIDSVQHAPDDDALVRVIVARTNWAELRAGSELVRTLGPPHSFWFLSSRYEAYKVALQGKPDPDR